MVDLHAAEAYSDAGGRTLLTLADLDGLLLFRCVIPVLSRAHLQIKHTWNCVEPRQVLQQDEFVLVAVFRVLLHPLQVLLVALEAPGVVLELRAGGSIAPLQVVVEHLGLLEPLPLLLALDTLVLILPSVSGPVLAVALIVQQLLTDAFYFVIGFQLCRGVHVLQVPKVTVQRVRNKTQISFLVLLETHRHHTCREME